MHVVFTGSFEWMNYMYTLWLGYTNFLNTLRPFLKPWIQKSDIKEGQNLKYRHSLGVITQDLKIPPVCLVTSPRAASDFHP
jgi:hypothetical protein